MVGRRCLVLGGSLRRGGERPRARVKRGAWEGGDSCRLPPYHVLLPDPVSMWRREPHRNGGGAGHRTGWARRACRRWVGRKGVQAWPMWVKDFDSWGADKGDV